MLRKMMQKMTESSVKVQKMFLILIATLKIGTDDIMNKFLKILGNKII